MERKNHIRNQAELCLEIASLIDAAIENPDPGVSAHLGRMAKARAVKLHERLEEIYKMVSARYTPEEVREIDEAVDNIVPLIFKPIS